MTFCAVENVLSAYDSFWGVNGVWIQIISLPTYRLHGSMRCEREPLWEGCLEVLEDAVDHAIRPGGSCFTDQRSAGIADAVVLVLRSENCG